MKKAIIKIIDEHISGNESAAYELTTVGTFGLEGDRLTVKYMEADEELVGCETTLEVEENKKVTLFRTGKYAANLIIEKGCRHICCYETPFGALMMGVYASCVQAEVNEKGGTLKFCYTIDFNNEVASENKLNIEITCDETSQCH